MILGGPHRIGRQTKNDPRTSLPPGSFFYTTRSFPLSQLFKINRENKSNAWEKKTTKYTKFRFLIPKSNILVIDFYDNSEGMLFLHIVHFTHPCFSTSTECTSYAMSFHILACGSNGSYQLGLGNAEDHDTLQSVSGLENLSYVAPKMLAFGGNHTFILYPGGQLFAAGDNEYGQCGVEAPCVLKTFTRVPGNWKIVAAGWQFSVLCSSENELYSCGYGPKGELGLGENRLSAKTPTRIALQGTPEIEDLKCSINHTVLRLTSGEFIGCGVCRKGQLGMQEHIRTSSGKLKPRQSLWEPTPLFWEGANSFCVGRDRTILVGDTIRIIGSEAQEVDVQTEKVCAMWSSIHYTKPGYNEYRGVTKMPICSVGNNLHGQCFRYPLLKPMRNFTVGSEHGLVLLSDNAVYAWGWGEHGNCGIMKNREVTFDYLNELYSGSDEVIMIAGGLATSWVVVRRETE